MTRGMSNPRNSPTTNSWLQLCWKGWQSRDLSMIMMFSSKMQTINLLETWVVCNCGKRDSNEWKVGSFSSWRIDPGCPSIISAVIDMGALSLSIPPCFFLFAKPLSRSLCRKVAQQRMLSVCYWQGINNFKYFLRKW